MNSGSKDLTIYILEKDVSILPQAWAKEKILSPHEEYLFCWFDMHSSVWTVNRKLPVLKSSNAFSGFGISESSH